MLTSLLFISTLVTSVPDGSSFSQPTKFESNMRNEISKAEIHVIKDFSAVTQANTYNYFSLTSESEVAAADAKTTKWDLAFSGTTILTNGGTSGSGQGGAIVVEKPFDTITEAPKDGYKVDGGSGNAIASGSGNSWYKYDMSVHAILPIVGRTIIVKTAEGKFAKIEFISYYKGAPEDVPTEESKYYTFRYVLADENGKF
ncbi:HmuY family protein [Dyadobacter subterraneus]|nr:HmuY family protein [Dyadobacter subterraneus]